MANTPIADECDEQQQVIEGGVAVDVEEEEQKQEIVAAAAAVDAVVPVGEGVCSKKLLLCRRFKDSVGILRNFNSLPLFVYATSPSTHATSADGVGVAKEAAAAAAAAAAVNKVCALDVKTDHFNLSTHSAIINDSYDLALCTGIGSNSSSSSNGGLGLGTAAIIGAMDCLPLSSSGSSAHHHVLSSSAASNAGCVAVSAIGSAGVGTVAVVGAGGIAYQHHLNLNHLNSTHHHLLGHHTPYSNNYPLHHSSSHHHVHSDQTKSLQELQHEVGALLEFRDLVIETFPDLKHKMASMSSSSASTAAAVNHGSVSTASVSGTNTLTGSGGMSNSSLVSRREWEPGIRLKRKVSQKEPSKSTAATTGAGGASELSSSSLTRSRSNSHSGKKEPKSGENNNGSVVQDSGFSTETSSSKEGHSASSTNGAMTNAIALNRLSCPESDDELLNLLDVIHRKSNRLREEMEHLQNYERQNLRSVTGNNSTDESTATTSEGRGTALLKSSSGSSTTSGLTPKTFREHVERLNKEDIKQLRRERDRLLDKLAEMEAETLTGRIKAAKMNDQVEELISVKKDLEEQLKLAMAQKLELSSRVQQLQLQQQQQQQQLQSKSSSSQSDYSSQRNFLSSATTVLSTGSGASVHLDSVALTGTVPASQCRRPNTFQPVVIEQQSPQQSEDTHFAFHQSTGSDSKKQQQQQQQQQEQLEQLGRLDGIVSTPGSRSSKCRVADSKRFAAILLETSVIELQRHLLTLTVQNQVLMQKLDQATKSKHNFAKRLDKSKDDVEDLRFQLEEKNIELEGTKAQLRVLESRIHSSTPNSGAATSSYLHSQNDYETNRSSASTTLMLSRRGISNSDAHYSDLRSPTPTSHNGQMPSPNVTQISTPSMKAMVHLPMDELQQHSSSTESAHEHELQTELPQSGAIGRLMSTSVGGVSPFEQSRVQQSAKKLGAGSKPSKIPLPGSKAAAYFAGKPPSGRPSTAGRSPPLAHAYGGSNSSSKSSLSRSTGNLLYSKSPNSLKRADSAQSMRKDSSSISTNTSRSSTSSSIPMATTPYATSKTNGAAPTPSPRVLQNSPLPKLKRESFSSRVRHLDSLSRVHQHNHSTTSNGSDVSCTSPPTPLASAGSPNGSYLVSSTPKPSSIAAQLNAAMRKDSQSNAQGSQQFLRRTTGGAATATATSPSMVNANSTARRFSSASVVGARIAGRSQHETTNGGGNVSNGEQPSGGGAIGANASDSDSGKHSLFYEQLPSTCGPAPAPTPNTPTGRQCRWLQTAAASPLWQRKFNATPLRWWPDEDDREVARIPTQIYQNQQFEICYNNNTTKSAIGCSDVGANNKLNMQRFNNNNCNYIAADVVEEEEQRVMHQQPKCAYFPDEEEVVGAYYSHDCSNRSSERGSDNLLVTFDYGYCDSIASIEAEISANYADAMGRHVEHHAIEEEEQEEEEQELAVYEPDVGQRLTETMRQDVPAIDDADEQEASIWFNTTLARANNARGPIDYDVDVDVDDVATAFTVHRMQHQLQGSVNSLLSSYSGEYGVDEERRSVCSLVDNRCRVDIAAQLRPRDIKEDENEEKVEEEQFYDSLECII